MDHQTQSPPPSLLGRIGKWLGIVGAVLCGLLVVAILGTVIVGANLPYGDTSGSMAVGFTHGVLIPLASIPIGIVCLLGAVLSRLAWRKQATSDARIGFLLSLAAPGVVVVCYAASLALSR
jgi:hypothetical protein